MSASYPAFLGLHSLHHCFAFAKYASPFSTDNGTITTGSLGAPLGAFRVRGCDDPSIVLYVQLFGKLPFSHVIINSKFANLAGFQEGQEVILEPVSTLVCNAVEVAPVSADDFEIVDKSSSTVEAEFLGQIRVVGKGMIVPFWVSSGISASMKVVGVVPDTNEPVLVGPTTELHVVPVSNGVLPMSRAERKQSLNMPKVQGVFDSLTDSLSVGMSLLESTVKDMIYRIAPNEWISKHKSLASIGHPSLIYALHQEPNCYSSFDFVTVRSNMNVEQRFCLLIQYPESDNDEGLANSLNTILKYRRGHCVVFDSIFEAYTKIACSSLDRRRIHVLKYVDVGVTNTDYESLINDGQDKELINALSSLTHVYPILLTSLGLRHTVSIEGRSVQVMLNPSSLDLIELNQSANLVCFVVRAQTKLVLQKLSEENAQKGEVDAIPSQISNYGLQKSNPALQLDCQMEILRELTAWVDYCDKATDFMGHALLLGKEGSGKSVTLNRLAKRLAKSPKCYFSVFIDCGSWKGKQADAIEKSLNLEMRRLNCRRASVLLLDGLDFMVVSGEEEQRQLAVEKIFEMLWRILSSCSVPVVASARKLSTLHRTLVSQGGKRLFGTTIEIDSLNQESRLSVLREFLDLDSPLEAAAKATENFSLADLRKLATRIQIESRIRGSTSINAEDVTKALSFSRANVGTLQKTVFDERKMSLDDVGGMRQEKQLMIEVLIWPFKYGELYARCGVKIGRGVLLHGASGCGKTLLANTIAVHSKFDLISVKGPELLSKYIGSSEENVRSVFERARASAPCVVLFDELDSLAPRRGSDSTGVTDRVVNQLLTELDGAEGLQGVFVIGCTSRIDLIDPALLRPGRFDHLVECKPPNEGDRAEILSIVLRNAGSGKNVNARDLARRTMGWTGADLRALVTNAQFHAQANRPMSEDDDCDIVVKQEDIEAVFDDSKPKPREEQKRSFRAGQKVTLA